MTPRCRYGALLRSGIVSYEGSGVVLRMMGVHLVDLAPVEVKAGVPERVATRGTGAPRRRRRFRDEALDGRASTSDAPLHPARSQAIVW